MLLGFRLHLENGGAGGCVFSAGCKCIQMFHFHEQSRPAGSSVKTMRYRTAAAEPTTRVLTKHLPRSGRTLGLIPL